MSHQFRLDHIIHYASDNGLADVKSLFGEYGHSVCSPDRTDIGFGVHACYFRLGDIVLEFMSVVDEVAFREADSVMPFSTLLRETKAAFAPGYHHDDLQRLHSDLVAAGISGLKFYSSGTSDEPDKWQYLLFEDVFSGTATFAYTQDDDHPEFDESCDAMGIDKVEELWFVSDKPPEDAGLWHSVFSKVADCDLNSTGDRIDVSFEGRTLSWMTSESFTWATGKLPGPSCQVKYGQLSGFVGSIKDQNRWSQSLGVSAARRISGEDHEGIYLAGPTDVVILART